MSTDFLSAVIDGLETAGPWAAWWVGVTAAVVVAVAGCRAGAAIARRRRRIPAAPDNQAGRNTADLSTCRRILAATNQPRKETKP